MGGLNLGSFVGVEVLHFMTPEGAQEPINPFARGASVFPIVIILGCAGLGPFLVQAVLKKWPKLYYPVLAGCALVVFYDFYLLADVIRHTKVEVPGEPTSAPAG